MNENDLYELDQEQLNDERLRRMKTLMRQLYREEFETKRLKLPPVKGKTLILFVSFVSVIVFGVTTMYNYNRFVALEEDILSAKGHVEAALQFRANLFSNLFNLALNQADTEREVFHYVANARTEIKGVVGRGVVAGEGGGVADANGGAVDAKPTVAAAGSPATAAGQTGLGATANFTDTVSRLLAIVEQYPDIKSSTTYQQLMDKLVSMEERVATRRNEANEAIRVYNILTTTFPWHILSKATGFARYDYFKFNVNDTLLSADVFGRLLPAAASARQRVSSPIPGPVDPGKVAAP